LPPRLPVEKLSMKRTVLRSSGTVVPPLVTSTTRLPAVPQCDCTNEVIDSRAAAHDAGAGEAEK
jgi:hypothetical protein